MSEPVSYEKLLAKLAAAETVIETGQTVIILLQGKLSDAKLAISQVSGAWTMFKVDAAIDVAHRTLWMEEQK